MIPPFVIQQPEDEKIPAAAIAFERFSPAYLLHKTEFLQQSDCPFVVFSHDRADAEQIQLGEREAEQHPQRLRAITFTAVLRRADTQAQETIAVRPLDPLDRSPADQPVVGFGANGEQALPMTASESKRPRASAPWPSTYCV